MSSPARLRLVRLGWSEEYGPEQVALAAVVSAAPSVFFAIVRLAGSPVSWWWLVLAPAGLLIVPRAESPWPLAVWALLLLVWVAQVPAPFTWWSVPAALVVALSHTALTLLAGRPQAGRLAPETARRTVRRLGVVGGVTMGVAVLSQAVVASHVGGLVILVVVALLLLALWLGWGWWRDEGTSAPGT